MSREKNEKLTRLHSRVHWLDSYNATLVTRLEDADARADQVTPLEARIRELEQELARATVEHDAQRAAADQKAQEA
jgi:transcription elongation GreA/GreB family factor